MEASDKIYYVVIQNRPYRHEYDNDDYHLEKVFTKEEINKIIKDEVHESFNHRYFIIVTNDKTFLNKYLFTINIDEFKLLCGISNYVANNIRINTSFYYKFDEEVFEYFQKIVKDEIITATELWTTETDYPYDDSSIGVTYENNEGWIENKEFKYFKTPARYCKNFNDDSVFSYKNYDEGNIETFKKLINVNILDIGTEIHPNINWEWRNGLLRYYDKISCTRLYITPESLQALKNDNKINFKIKTSLDKNQYIEYHIVEIKIISDDYEEDYEIKSNRDNSQYDKHNGAYGFDDDTIDSAFEGDPENYWNID